MHGMGSVKFPSLILVWIWYYYKNGLLFNVTIAQCPFFAVLALYWIVDPRYVCHTLTFCTLG